MMAFYEIESFAADGRTPPPDEGSILGVQQSLKRCTAGRVEFSVGWWTRWRSARRSERRWGSGTISVRSPRGRSDSAASAPSTASPPPQEVPSSNTSRLIPALIGLMSAVETTYIPVKWLTAGGFDNLPAAGSWYWASGDGQRGKVAGRVRRGGVGEWEGGSGDVAEGRCDGALGDRGGRGAATGQRPPRRRGPRHLCRPRHRRLLAHHPRPGPQWGYSSFGISMRAKAGLIYRAKPLDDGRGSEDLAHQRLRWHANILLVIIVLIAVYFQWRVLTFV